MPLIVPRAGAIFMKKYEISAVKSLLDHADWSADILHPEKWTDDLYKAINYLCKCRFSHLSINNEIVDSELQEIYGSDISSELVAIHISHNIAMNRISRYIWQRGDSTRKWAIPESTIFKIKI